MSVPPGGIDGLLLRTTSRAGGCGRNSGVPAPLAGGEIKRHYHRNLELRDIEGVPDELLS